MRPDGMSSGRIVHSAFTDPPTDPDHVFRRFVLTFALLTLAGVRTSAAQAAPRAFSIFLDCSDFYCESDYYRTEIAFVDHVRDRTAADVHVLITNQQTGGGGRAYTLAFYGQRVFSGISDTLKVELPQGATEAEQRTALARTVKLGLARYLARTPAGARASLALAAPPTDAPKAAATVDPWKAWVFRLSMNLNGNSEQSYESKYLYSSVSARRTTEDWKSSLVLSNSYNDSKFDVGAGDKVTSISRSYGINGQQAKSLTQHWSAGARAGASSSTYLNQQLALNAAGIVEYDLYPYSESTRRQLIAQYSIGGRSFRYTDTTVYFKIRETRPYQQLALAWSQRQKWGSVDLGATGYHFLDDPGKSRLNFNASTDIRIIKGLNLNSYVDYSVIHDQIYLAKGDLSREEVLLRQSQLQTGYRAYFYVGLSYTFGSVFNNVVNPRLNTGGDF